MSTAAMAAAAGGGDEDGTGGCVLGLDSGRRGEWAQVELLGRTVAERAGREFRRLRVGVDAVPAAAPALMVSFGEAGAMLELARRWRRRPLLVQLGTPGHAAAVRFDLILPMPQDDYPPAANVLRLALPLNGARLGAGVLPNRDGGTAGTVVVVGGTSRHMRLETRELRRMVRFGARLAAANGERLRLVGSPRTARRAAAALERLAAAHGTVVEHGDRAFAELLGTGNRFLVSADSASMVADTCRSGAPVWLFPLPFRADPMRLLQEAVDLLPGGRALRHALVRRGRVGGGTDFRRWHRALERDGMVRRVGGGGTAALRWRPAAGRADPDLAACLERLLMMLERADGGG